MRTFFTMLGVDCAAKVSLAMQFIGELSLGCWGGACGTDERC